MLRFAASDLRLAAGLFVLLQWGARGAAAQTEPTGDGFSRAHAREAVLDLEGAAADYERYAQTCLAASTPSARCDRAGTALESAFRLRRLLGQRDRADATARRYLAHFLYARPRASLRMARARVQMHLDQDDPETAESALAEFTSLLPDPPPAQRIVTDALTARVALARGDRSRATRWFRRVERGYAALEPMSDGPVPTSWVHEAVAGARLLRAEEAVARYLATRVPRTTRVRDERRWWRQTMSPWLVRQRRRLLMARMALERVYELGSPRHSVIAAARIGQLYGHRAALHQALELPGDDWVQTLVHEGVDRPGYDQARQHFETCVEWAAHHQVAERWSLRCQAALRELDPVSPAVSLELHGSAGHLPADGAPVPVAYR